MQPMTISPARVRVFRTALGQLLTTSLFQNEAADLDPLVEAVNARLAAAGSSRGEESFSSEEASRALLAMQERNEIM